MQNCGSHRFVCCNAASLCPHPFCPVHFLAELVHVYLASKTAGAGTQLTMLSDIAALMWASGALHVVSMYVCGHWRGRGADGHALSADGHFCAASCYDLLEVLTPRPFSLPHTSTPTHTTHLSPSTRHATPHASRTHVTSPTLPYTPLASTRAPPTLQGQRRQCHRGPVRQA